MVFRVLNYNAALSGTYAYWTRHGMDAKAGISLALQKLASFLVVNTGIGLSSESRRSTGIRPASMDWTSRKRSRTS